MSAIQTLLERDRFADAHSLSSRLEEFRDLEQIVGPRPIDLESSQPGWSEHSGVPEVDYADFTDQALLSAMASSGCLIVRGFFDANVADTYKPLIDQMLDAAYGEASEGNSDPVEQTLHNPPEALSTLIPKNVWANSRGFHRRSGSVMCVESSGICEQLIELYDSRNLRSIAENYLGEAPCLSALKWVLRRSKLPINPAGWHQDGAFMGEDINSLNMWLALDHCGGDSGAPGLDVVPMRLREIVGAGEDDAALSWSVGDGAVSQKFGADQLVSPVFKPGDVFFFDHFLLHRTQYAETFPRLRYAIETWFFGAKNFPKNQIPMRW